MSKAVRKVEILELVAKASDALQHALEPTQEMLKQVPDGVFQSKIPEDWGPQQYEAETLKLLKTLAGVVKNKDALETPVDYQEVGKANILLQAVDAVNSLMQGQSEFIEICKQEIIDLEKETNRLNILAAAVEERQKNGDDLGDIGRNKEISPEEGEKIQKYIKTHDNKCQQDLGNVIDKLFDSDADDMKKLISILFKNAIGRQGDPYISVTPGNVKLITRLRMFNVLEDHPHDNSKVKLISPD